MAPESTQLRKKRSAFVSPITPGAWVNSAFTATDMADRASRGRVTGPHERKQLQGDG